MPFVEILWNPARFTPDQLSQLREVVISAVAREFEFADPDHVVTPAMVDVRFLEQGPLDRLRSDLFITVLARSEERRRKQASSIAEAINEACINSTKYAAALTELVLTDHYSTFDYSTLE